MKFLNFTYILALVLITQSVSFAQDPTDETTGYYQQQDDELDQLSKVLEIPEVKKIQKQCEDNAFRAATGVAEIGDCIWKVIEDTNNQDLKDKIQAQMDETLAAQDGVSQHESVKVVSLKNENSESMKALEKFYAQKLSKELFGEGSASNSDLSVSKKTQLLDHKKFNKIYENQMTKNILSAVSTYCIEAEMIGNYNFPLLRKDVDKRRDQRKKNMSKLSGAQVTRTNSEGAVETISSLKNSSEKWQSCMVNIQYVCHGGDKQIKDSAGNIVLDAVGEPETVKADTEFQKTFTSSHAKGTAEYKKEKEAFKEDKEYSKMRACEVTNYLKVAKQNLKAIEKINEGYKQLQQAGGYKLEGKDIKNKVITEEITLDNGKLDNITSTTSNEFVNESEFGKETNSDLANLEKCVQKNAQGTYEMVAGAEDFCKKYLNTDHDSVEKIKQEHTLRQKALANKVQKLQNGTEDEIKEFLIDQGRDPETLDDELANIDIDKLKAQITARYSNEKDELIKSLNAKLEAQTSQSEATIDGTIGSSDMNKLEAIHRELSAKTESYAQLIHYNNMVTGLLEIKDDSGNVRRNTASVEREMNSNAFDEKNIDDLKLSDATKQTYVSDSENLADVVSGENISDSSSDSDTETSTTIGVDKLNEEVLNYDVEGITP